jgi:hypothetical protein
MYRYEKPVMIQRVTIVKIRQELSNTIDFFCLSLVLAPYVSSGSSGPLLKDLQDQKQVLVV